MKNVMTKGVLLSALLGFSVADAAAQGSLEELNASAGMGYNSNVYRAPSAAYNDLAAGGVLVNPDVQGGVFVPLALDAKYMLSRDTELSYKFNGEFYLDNALTNGNNYTHRIEVARPFDVRRGFFADSDISGALLLNIHNQVYYDRDSGAEKLSPTSLTNISNRYNYIEYGVKGDMEKKIGDTVYNADAQFSMLSYDTPAKASLSTLDHSCLQLGGSARFPVMNNEAKLKLGYDFTRRAYSNRSARDANGTLAKANGLLTYNYHDFSAQLYKKLSKQTRVYADFTHGIRTDDFVQYNDYTKETLKLRVLHEYSSDLDMKGKVTYSDTTYPNAFAFEDPNSAKKTSSALLLSLQGDYKGDLKRVVNANALWASVDYKDYSSNDLRYNYNATEIAVGGEWKF